MWRHVFNVPFFRDCSLNATLSAPQQRLRRARRCGMRIRAATLGHPPNMNSPSLGVSARRRQSGSLPQGIGIHAVATPEHAPAKGLWHGIPAGGLSRSARSLLFPDTLKTGRHIASGRSTARVLSSSLRPARPAERNRRRAVADQLVEQEKARRVLGFDAALEVEAARQEPAPADGDLKEICFLQEAWGMSMQRTKRVGPSPVPRPATRSLSPRAG